MSQSEDFTLKLRSIYRLAYFQRIIRGLLRATWLGIMGYSGGLILEGISKNNLNPLIKWILAGLLGCIGFYRVVFPIVSSKRFVWRLDRLLGTKEQLSTAIEFHNAPPNPIVAALKRDVEEMIPSIHRTVRRKGWKIVPEVDFLLISLAVFALVSLSTLPPLTSSADYGVDIPSLRPERGENEVFHNGIFGLTQEDVLSYQQAQSSAARNPSDSTPQNLTQPPSDQMSETFQEVGKQLKDNPLTQPLGEALEEGNLEKAAQMLDSVANQINSLPPFIQDQLSEKFEQAAQTVEEGGMESLAEQMKNTAQEIREGNQDTASESLKQLSQELNQLAQTMKQDQAALSDQLTPQSGTGPGSGSEEAKVQTGSPTPFERLGESGETLTFNTGKEGVAQILQPGRAASSSQGQIVSGSLGSNNLFQPSSFTGEILPYPLIWTWLNEIKLYFFPQ